MSKNRTLIKPIDVAATGTVINVFVARSFLTTSPEVLPELKASKP